MSLLDVRDLVVRLKSFELGPVSLSLGAGASLAVVGSNGSGKSTLLTAILGLRPAVSGDVEINGAPVDVTHPPQGVGAVLQIPGFLPWADAATNLRLVCGDLVDPDGISPVLGRVGLADVASKPLSNFSTGMLCRFALARALIMDPQLLVLDEPTIGLDHRGVEWLISELSDVMERGVGVILATHDADLLDGIGGPRLRIEHGRAVESPSEAGPLGR